MISLWKSRDRRLRNALLRCAARQAAEALASDIVRQAGRCDRIQEPIQ